MRSRRTTSLHEDKPKVAQLTDQRKIRYSQCTDYSSSMPGCNKPELVRCRICGSDKITKRGEVEFYLGYAWPIYDCDDCGCRFTLHDTSIYDLLYSEQSSCYSRYAVQAQTCKMLFDRGDLAGLRAALSEGFQVPLHHRRRSTVSRLAPVSWKLAAPAATSRHISFLLGGELPEWIYRRRRSRRQRRISATISCKQVILQLKHGRRTTSSFTSAPSDVWPIRSE